MVVDVPLFSAVTMNYSYSDNQKNKKVFVSLTWYFRS